MSRTFFRRGALLVCDECERVRRHDGKLSEKRLSQISASELEAHLGDRGAITMPAIHAGWEAKSERGQRPARWTCPDCLRRKTG